MNEVARNAPFRILLWLTAAFALSATLLSALPAEAHSFTKSDGNDSPSKIDLRSVSVSHTSTGVVHKVRTWNSWTPVSLQHDSFFVIGINKDDDPAYERCAFIFYTSRLRGELSNCGSRFIRFLPVAKVNATTAKITIPKTLLRPVYKWFVQSIWVGAAPCRNGCNDFAPNVLPDILHDLTPPVVTMPSPDPIRVWEGIEGTGPSFRFPFNVTDPGGSWGSGIATWKIQRRLVGSSIWTDTGVSGTGAGDQDPLIPGVEETRADYRVVATDRHSNRTNGTPRLVYVPTDDDDLAPEDFSVAPTPSGADLTAFGGGYSLMATSDVFTYPFSPVGPECTFELIGPGNGTWEITVTADGGSEVTRSGADFPDEPRQTIYSDDSCATTYVVTVTAGTFGLDAVLG
jgi:hypothetical protein